MIPVAWLIMGEKPAGPPAPHDFFATRNVAVPILGAFGAAGASNFIRLARRPAQSERPSLLLQSSLRSVALLGREGLSLWAGNLAG